MPPAKKCCRIVALVCIGLHWCCMCFALVCTGLHWFALVPCTLCRIAIQCILYEKIRVFGFLGYPGIKDYIQKSYKLYELSLGNFGKFWEIVLYTYINK